MTNQDIIDALRARGIAEADVSDDTIEDLIDKWCVKQFNRYAPIVACRTFDTVADQSEYTPTQMGDEHLQDVLFCIWASTGSSIWSWSDYATMLGIPTDTPYYHLPSQAWVEQIKSAAWDDCFTGSGARFDSTHNVRLSPCPRLSGLTVFIVYTTNHADISTIDDEYFEAFTELVHGECCGRMVSDLTKKSMAMRVKTPEYELQLGEQVGALRKMQSEHKRTFHDLMCAGKAQVERT